MSPVHMISVCTWFSGGGNVTRSRRLATVALGGAVALTCALPMVPAQAADSPVGTVRLRTEKRIEIDYQWAGTSGFQYHSYVGNYFTSLEMLGVTVTIMKVDAELKELIAAEATSIGLKQAKLS